MMLAISGCVASAAEPGFTSQETQTETSNTSSTTSTTGTGLTVSSGGGKDGGAGPEASADASADGSSARTAPVYPTISSYVGGVNLSGGSFGKLPGVYGTDYEYPTTAEVDSFYADGMRIFRMDFLWERVQPKLGGAYSTTEIGRLQSIVSYATAKGAYVILNPQDFARYNDVVIGAGDGTAHPTADDFGDFWAEMAQTFASNPKVIFGLMNEPNTMSTELWLADANTAIASIRATGATNLITVPGNGWTGAATWTTTNDYGTANSQVMLGVKDPLDNFMYELHAYFDSDGSGTSKTCSGASAATRLAGITSWLETNHKKAFLAEIGTSTDSSCAGVADAALTYLDQHKDAWAGWTWWAAGPIWSNGYMFSIEPKVGAALSLVPMLLTHL